MSGNRVVITGVGPVTAAGMGRESLADALRAGDQLFSPIEEFTPLDSEPKKAAQIPDFEAKSWMPRAIIRQTDRATHFAFAAAQLALEDAQLDIESINRLRIGIMIGQALGGMVFAEPQLYNHWIKGPSAISTYQSIAWFYAAAMGQLSINLGLRGYSKTFVADRVSGMHAIGHAFRIIQEGKIDICLAGGAEAPLSPFIYRSIASTGQLSLNGYEPFGEHGQGFLLGEGAALVVMESREHALDRGAPIYCEISGYGMATDCSATAGTIAAPTVLARAMRLAAQDNGASTQSRNDGVSADGVFADGVFADGVFADGVFADGVGYPEGDNNEIEAIQQLLSPAEETPPISVPKAVVGELYGGGAPLQVVAAAMAIKDGCMWPIRRGRETPNHVEDARSQRLERVFVNSRGLGGLCAALTLNKQESTAC